MEHSLRSSPKSLFSVDNDDDISVIISSTERKNFSMEKDLRKQLGLKKSLLLLEQSAQSGYRSASPLLNAAETTQSLFAKNDFPIRKDSQSQLYRVSTSLEFNATAIDEHPRSFVTMDTTGVQSSYEKSETNFTTIHENEPPKEDDCNEVFTEFMQLYTNHPHSADVFELIDQYEQVCRKKIKSIQAHIHKTDPSRKRSKKLLSLLYQFYEECYTWRLISALFRDRMLCDSMNVEHIDTMMPMDSAQSEKLIVDSLFERESCTRQCQIIVDWLEKNMQDKLEDLLATENVQFHSDSSYWEHTVHDLIQVQLGSRDPSLAANLVTEIDPDAPVRQQRALSNLDQQDEEQLLTFMFKFIRAGKLEEAQKLCNDLGHFWRAASLDGWRLWHDPNYFADTEDEILPAEGNPDRDLWKINCWSLAEEKSLNTYEKAMYAALSGHLSQLLPVCSSWEDCVWAHFKVLVDVRVEQEIRNQPHTGDTMLDLPDLYWTQVQQNELTTHGIMGQIKGHPNSDIRKQCDTVYKKFQTNIILNEITEFLNEMGTLVKSGRRDVHLSRFMAHLVLFLQAVGLQTQEDICVDVLHHYVEVLMESSQGDLVATYTARLPPEMQVQVYSKFLQDVHDSALRQKYLDLGEEAGLGLQLITKNIVERIRTKSDDVAQNNTSDKLDKEKINSIDWLIFDPFQRNEAVKQANAIIRGFLAQKKHEACQLLFDKIPADSIDVIYTQWRRIAGEKPLPHSDDDSIREFLCIKAYLQAHDAFNVWFEHFHHQAPIAPEESTKRTFKDQIAFEENMKEYEVEYSRWLKTLDAHVKSTSDSIYNVLLFPGGWMVDQHDDSSEQQRKQQMLLLRQLCIPYLSFLLISVLQPSHKHKECFQLAECIQSRHYKLYEVFLKADLQKLLELLRNSSISFLQSGFDPLGFERLNAI